MGLHWCPRHTNGKNGPTFHTCSRVCVSLQTGDGTLEHDRNSAEKGRGVTAGGQARLQAGAGLQSEKTGCRPQESSDLVRMRPFLSGRHLRLFIWILKKRGLLKGLGRLGVTGGFSGSPHAPIGGSHICSCARLPVWCRYRGLPPLPPAPPMILLWVSSTVFCLARILIC